MLEISRFTRLKSVQILFTKVVLVPATVIVLVDLATLWQSWLEHPPFLGDFPLPRLIAGP